jgi:hypothetical protein
MHLDFQGFRICRDEGKERTLGPGLGQQLLEVKHISACPALLRLKRNLELERRNNGP